MPDEYVPTSENEANFDDIDEGNINEVTVNHGRSEQPIEPTEPAEPNEPVEPSEPSETSEPSEPEAPSDPSDPNNPDFPDGNEPSEPVEPNEPTEPEVPSEPEDNGEEEYYSSLTEATGYEITSSDDIVAMAQRLDYLEENPYENLPKEAQMVVNAISNGGDYKNSLRLLSLDVENLRDKEALRESYFLDSKVSSNRELAELQFEKDFDNKYGILDELNKISDQDERAEFEAENERAIKLAKLSFEQDVKDAKERINGFVDENTTKSPVDSISKEEREEFLQNHVNSVEQTVSEFDGVTFSFGDNGDIKFNLQLTEEQQEGLQNFLTNPEDFFREEIGFDIREMKYTDYHSMSALYTIISNLDNLPNMLGQFYMEKSDEKTVEEIVQNTEKPKQPNSRPQTTGGQGIDLDADPDWS